MNEWMNEWKYCCLSPTPEPESLGVACASVFSFLRLPRWFWRAAFVWNTARDCELLKSRVHASFIFVDFSSTGLCSSSLLLPSELRGWLIYSRSSTKSCGIGDHLLIVDSVIGIFEASVQLSLVFSAQTWSGGSMQRERSHWCATDMWSHGIPQNDSL